MNRSILCLIATCLAVVNANPFVWRQHPRIANGTVTTGSIHAAIILVINDAVGEGNAILGGGSIISTRHVLTAASLVIGNPTNTYQIGYRTGPSVFQVIAASVAAAHPNYNPSTLENDIALIFLPIDKQFPERNIIGIAANSQQPAANDVGQLVSYGFTAAGQNEVSQKAILANQTVVNGTATKFTAVDQGTQAAIVCPGDGGSGLFSIADAQEPAPTAAPTAGPTDAPTAAPTATPTDAPTQIPSVAPPTEDTTLPTPSVATTTESTITESATTYTGATATLIGVLSRIPDTSCTKASTVTYTRVSFYQNWISTTVGLPAAFGMNFHYRY